jgi:hypothetical protein
VVVLPLTAQLSTEIQVIAIPILANTTFLIRYFLHKIRVSWIKMATV